MAAPQQYRPTSTHLESDRRRLVAANDAAVTWFRAQLIAAPEPRRYLHERGLGAVVDREWPWRIGYAPPGWRTLTDHLRAGGFTPDELVTAGLSTRTRNDPDRLIDVFRDRIIFPIRNPTGHVVGFIGRASPTALHADPQLPKYLNTHASPIYDKDQLLFGMTEQQDRIAAGWTPVLVEGPADTLATWLSYSRSGRAGAVAVAPCGTAFSAAQAAMLRPAADAAGSMVVAFDGDTAGRKAADAVFDLMSRPRPRWALLAAEFAAGADPADLLTRPNGRAQLRAALQRQTRPLALAVIDHHLERVATKFPRALQEIEGRFAAARALSRHVFGAASTTEAVQLARHIASRTGTGLDTVLLYAAEHLQERLAEVGTHNNGRLPATAGRPPPTAAFPLLAPTASRPVAPASALAPRAIGTEWSARRR